MKRSFAYLLVFVMLVLPGCFQPKARELTGSGMDMFGPTTMRIHPLTRIVLPEPKSELEVRIELSDQMGDVGKGVGTLYFELFDYEIAALGHKGPRVTLWNSDISTPALNKQYWDPITRTYLFHLGSPKPGLFKSGRKFVLDATMVFPNNTRLQDDLTLSVK